MSAYPDQCLQTAVGDSWWVRHEGQAIPRGSLIFAFIPHVDQTPLTLIPVGRTEASQHNSAHVKVAPLNANQPLKKSSLPVAAMPLHAGEVWAAYRAKKRPCLVVGSPSPSIERKLTAGKPNHATAPTVLVAPYYGVDQGDKRAGYNPAFVERVRHCEYSSFLWDRLPILGGPEESLLRLDHLQPIGTHYQSYKHSGLRLSDQALEVVDEQLQWLLMGGLEEDSLIALYRAEIEELYSK